MKAAIVAAAGETPTFGEFETPSEQPGRLRLQVLAAAISQLTRARASGRHYSAGGQWPIVPGVDGVGRTEDGRRVYFVLPEAPFGAMAEYTLVNALHCAPVPDALTDETAAAMANPGMSSWAALKERARFVAGETVLINGATGSSGKLAIQIARHLGASRIIATGRNAAQFETLRRLGADVTIGLQQDPDALETALKAEFAQGIDVVLDYLWGPSARAIMIAAAKAGPELRPIRFIQIGSMGGADIDVPAAALRSSSLQLMGSGIGSVSLERLLASIRDMLAAAAVAGFECGCRSLPLSEVASAWADDHAGDRVVLRP